MSNEEEVRITSFFDGSVASDERELAIDEGVSASRPVPSFHFVPDSNVVVRNREECVKRALEEVEENYRQAEEASEGDSFVDLTGSLEKETGGESEGFTLANFLQRADLLSETVLEVLADTLQFVVVLVFIFHIPLVFICRNFMVATHIFYKLVFNPRLYMKMASRGFCVLVFDSSREPVNCPEEMVCGVPCSFGTEFVVGRSTSHEEAVGASTGAPMEIPSSLQHRCALCWKNRDFF